MSKSYKQQPLHPLQAAKPSTVNRNIEASLAEFNGKLDGSNMPVGSVSTTHMVSPSVAGADISASGIEKRSSRTSTQAYHSVEKYSSDVFVPVMSIDLKTEQWSRGWNKLHEYSEFGGFPLVFEAEEGMLSGCAVIDWHHGINRVQVSDGEGTSFQVYRGYDWWTEWGVFVNNVLVARSGLIFPRRHTTQLPFTVPVGSQVVQVDVRFITNTTKDTDPVLTFTGDPSTEFEVFGATTWVRNNYR